MPDDHSTHYKLSDDSKGYNLMHLNALYDLMNRRYMDAVLQDSRNENENSALISMLKNVGHDSIIVADRGYESYNNIAHFEAQGLKYVIRVRSKYGIADKFNLPVDKESDFTADVLLTRRQTNEVKSNPDKYRLINSGSAFDFIPKGSKDTYSLKIRIIRIKISEGQ
ncbi:MAG: transposase [Oscillospiraceae bacterium]|nr:transposase [Oscillospiraceae bacterium]